MSGKKINPNKHFIAAAGTEFAVGETYEELPLNITLVYDFYPCRETALQKKFGEIASRTKPIKIFNLEIGDEVKPGIREAIFNPESNSSIMNLHLGLLGAVYNLGGDIGDTGSVGYKYRPAIMKPPSKSKVSSSPYGFEIEQFALFERNGRSVVREVYELGGKI